MDKRSGVDGRFEDDQLSTRVTSWFHVTSVTYAQTHRAPAREIYQGWVPSRLQRPRALRQAQSRLSKALFANQGRQPLAELKVRAETVAGQRASMRYSRAIGKGAMAWATRQGVDNRERVKSSLFQEILVRKPGIMGSGQWRPLSKEGWT